jgi:hypothetical protein
MKKFAKCDVAKVGSLAELSAVRGSELAGVEGGLAPLAAVGAFFLVHAIAGAVAGGVVVTAKAVDKAVS